MPLLPLLQHTDDEYGAEVGPDGVHHGGPFEIQVSPKMRVEELRKIIRVGVYGGRCGEGPTHCCALPAWRRRPAGTLCQQVWLMPSEESTKPAGAHSRVQDKGGIIPALQRLSYAGKNMEDSQRTLEQ